jgi:hypothetical protein
MSITDMVIVKWLVMLGRILAKSFASVNSSGFGFKHDPSTETTDFAIVCFLAMVFSLPKTVARFEINQQFYCQ